MKRTLCAALLAAALVVSACATADAAPRKAKKSRSHSAQVALNAACQVTDASQCSGPCTPCPGASVSVRTAASKPVKATAASRACPVSDASACPSWCLQSDIGAVAAVAAKR